MEENQESIEHKPGQGNKIFVIVILCFLLIITQITINIVNEFLFIP